MFAAIDKHDLENVQNCRRLGVGSVILPNGMSALNAYLPIVLRGRPWGVVATVVLPQAMGVNVPAK